MPDTRSKIDWKQFARHSFSLFGARIRLSPQKSKMSDLTASLSLAERWTITEIRQQLNSLQTYSLLTDVPLLSSFQALIDQTFDFLRLTFHQIK